MRLKTYYIYNIKKNHWNFYPCDKYNNIINSSQFNYGENNQCKHYFKS